MKRVKLLVAAVLALGAGACGGAAHADGGVASLDDSQLFKSVDSTSAPMTEEEALLAFTQCLRDNGVDIDDPTVDADGNLRLSRPTGGDGSQGPSEEAGTARQTCAVLLEGVALGFQDQDRTELEDQLLEFASCMRDNGFDMPDPDFSDTGTPGQGGPFGQLDRSDPDFQAASEACQDTLAGFGPGSGVGRRGGGAGGGGNG